MWQSNPPGNAPNILNEFRKHAWKPLIYLFLKKLETLESYSPVKLQLNLKCNSVSIYKSIYKPQLCNFTITWRFQVCKVSKNDIPHSHCFLVFYVRCGNCNLQNMIFFVKWKTHRFVFYLSSKTIKDVSDLIFFLWNSHGDKLTY